MKLQNTKLKKTGQNKFAGYSYFELGDFLPTVNSIFSELGLCGVVSFGNELATLTITDIDDNSAIEITSPMKEANLKGCHPIQNLGAVETYTRRYLWVTAMEIVEHDALDSSQPVEHPLKPKESAKTIAQDHWEQMDEEQQSFLNDIAVEMVSEIDDGNLASACKRFYQNNLTHEEQTALWSRLNSKERSAIKKYRDTQKEAA